MLRFYGFGWVSYFTHIVLDILGQQAWIKVLFPALKPCCKASCFDYNTIKFEYNFVGSKGGKTFDKNAKSEDQVLKICFYLILGG
jgi:hypothetical protein